jgi:hypothetical protein
MLARQAPYHTCSPFFALVFFERVSLYAQAGLDHDPPMYASLHR